MTKTKMQKFFSDAYRHFVLQGNPRSVEDGACLYRTVGGNACAIGLQIPDEFYSGKMESKSISSFFRSSIYNDLLAHWGVSKNSISDELFLIKLQRLHDNYFEQKDEWISFAREWNLRVPRK